MGEKTTSEPLRYTCSFSVQGKGISIYIGDRTGVASSILKGMPYGGPYVLLYSPDSNTITIKHPE